MRVWARLAEMLARHGTAGMVTVVRALGSTPREAGTRVLVQPDGGFAGTIGGGTLEWQAIALAQAALADKTSPEFQLRSFALGPELGQCCGGRVELAVERFGTDRREEIAALAEREALGSFATEGSVADRRLLRRPSPRSMPPGSAEWDGGVLREGFGETTRPLYLFGAGHVGRALVLALAPLPFTVTWLDPRPDAFPGHVPANVRTAGFSDAREALAGAPEGSFVLVMSHSHGLDLAIVHAALADERFPYVGLIGSATKRARFEKRLAEGSVERRRIESLVCPIGIAGIGSKAPAVIAAATVAEMLIRDEALRSAGSLETAEPARRRRRG